MDKKRREGGVTLMELMIVVVIVGILAAIAYPSYQEQVRKARRADAAGVLMQLAIVMERKYTETNAYADLITAGEFPNKSPLDGGDRFYTLAINTNPDGDATTQDYRLSAAPQNDQASDKCGTLTLTNTGVKGQKAGMTVDDCW